MTLSPISPSSALAVLNDLGAACHQRNKPYDAMKLYRKAIQMRKCNRSKMIHLRLPFSVMEHQKISPGGVAMDTVESSLIGMNMFSDPLQVQQAQKDISKITGIQGFSSEKEVLALVLFNVALVYTDSQNYDKAIEFLIQSADLIDGLHKCSGLEMMVFTNLGYVLYKIGHYEESIVVFERVKNILSGALCDTQLTLNHNTDHVLFLLVSSLLNLARSYDAIGQYDDATESVSQAVNLQSILKLSHIDSEATYIKALVHHHKKEYIQALKMYQAIVGAPKGLLPRLHLAAAFHGTGQALFEQGKLDKAMIPFLAALDIRRFVFGEIHPEVADTLYSIGCVLHDREEYGDALEVYLKTARIQRDTLGDGHLVTLRTLCNIARVYQVHNDHLQALDACMETLGIGQMLLGQTHCFVVEMLIMSGTLFYELGWGESAIATFEKVAKIVEPQRNAEDFLADCISTLSTSNMIPCATAA